MPMISKTRTLLCCLVALFLAVSAGAQSQSKIAVIDLDGLFFTVSEGRTLRTQLQELEQTTKAELEAIDDEIRRISQEATGKSAIEQRDAARKVEDKEREARRVAENARRRAAEFETTARKSFDERVEPLLREFQEAENIDLILNKTPGVVVFASTAIDISQALLVQLEPPN